MRVISKNNYRQTNFNQLVAGDIFVTCADIDPCQELLIKTMGGFGLCVQTGESFPFSGSDIVYEIDATIVVNY